MTKAKWSCWHNKKLGHSEACDATNQLPTHSDWQRTVRVTAVVRVEGCLTRSVECSRPASLSLPDGSQSLVSRGAGRQPVNQSPTWME